MGLLAVAVMAVLVSHLQLVLLLRHTLAGVVAVLLIQQAQLV
jgi:hypothetical protein